MTISLYPQKRSHQDLSIESLKQIFLSLLEVCFQQLKLFWRLLSPLEIDLRIEHGNDLIIFQEGHGKYWWSMCPLPPSISKEVLELADDNNWCVGQHPFPISIITWKLEVWWNVKWICFQGFKIKISIKVQIFCQDNKLFELIRSNVK